MCSHVTIFRLTCDFLTLIYNPSDTHTTKSGMGASSPNRGAETL